VHGGDGREQGDGDQQKKQRRYPEEVDDGTAIHSRGFILAVIVASRTGKQGFSANCR
jgi:adenine/guanine phosphoribosyltransferase-like PRPP-binding protein